MNGTVDHVLLNYSSEQTVTSDRIVRVINMKNN
jgi:hypothetical protein